MHDAHAFMIKKLACFFFVICAGSTSSKLVAPSKRVDHTSIRTRLPSPSKQQDARHLPAVKPQSPPPEYRFPQESIDSHFRSSSGSRHASSGQHASSSSRHAISSRHASSGQYTDYTTQSHYTSRHTSGGRYDSVSGVPSDSRIAARESSISTPRQRRRQEKKTSATDFDMKQSFDDLQLRAVDKTSTDHSLSHHKRASSVAECLNYVGSAANPPPSPSGFTVGAHPTRLSYNPREFNSDFFSSTSDGERYRDSYTSGTTTTRGNSTDKSAKSSSVVSSLSSKRDFTSSGSGTERCRDSGTPAATTTQFSSTDMKAKPYSDYSGSSNLFTSTISSASEHCRGSSTSDATTLLDSTEKSTSSRSSLRMLSPKRRLYKLLHKSRKSKCFRRRDRAVYE